jgi:flagellar protein FliS
MTENAAARYQQVQLRTSNPGEILIALFDGLFKFLLLAKHHMAAGRRGPTGEAISRAFAIVSELYCSLDHSKAPELCSNLSSLYDFALDRLTKANLKRDPAHLDEVIRVLTPIREAFTTVVKQQNAAAPSNVR